jgi:hypothetical protein
MPVYNMVLPIRITGVECVQGMVRSPDEVAAERWYPTTVLNSGLANSCTYTSIAVTCNRAVPSTVHSEMYPPTEMILVTPNVWILFCIAYYCVPKIKIELPSCLAVAPYSLPPLAMSYRYALTSWSMSLRNSTKAPGLDGTVVSETYVCWICCVTQYARRVAVCPGLNGPLVLLLSVRKQGRTKCSTMRSSMV